MPRDGSGIYTKPFPDVVEGTTIESAVHNGTVADVEYDLNQPRPISSGGTGANNAADAMSNLGGEGSKIEVTNYASHNFTAGSFYSKSTATGGPIDGHAFAGICYVAVVSGVATSDMFIEVRDRDEVSQPGSLYVRQKKAGTWSGWLKAVGATASATPPPTPADNTLWWDPTRGKLFIRYTDVDTSQWVETVAMPDMNPDDFVRIDASQTLTEAQKTQARKNISAAPFDTLAYNGMQINGSMEVNQQYGLANPVPPGNYFSDGWVCAHTGSAVLTLPIVGTSVPGLPKCVEVSVGTAQPSMGAGDYNLLVQNIEGYRVSRLAWGTASAQPITIGFWSGHARAGVYSVKVGTATGTRSYVTTYTQAAPGWQYNTITVPGDPAGTWPADNAAGLTVVFTISCGTTFTAPAANTWYVANYFAAPGQVNGVAATSDAFRITGVVVLPGIEAPSAARSALIMRPYDQELLTCKRYYLKQIGGIYSTAGAASRYFGAWTPFPVEMRSSPTTAFINAISSTNLLINPYAEGITQYGFRAMSQANATSDAAFIAQYSCDVRL